MTNKKSRELNMVEGSLGDKMLLFALPLALTGILQQLFNAADVAVVGTFAGKHAMAAVGSNAPVLALMVTLFVGISMGANVVIARFTGRRDEEMITKSIHTTVTLALLSGVLMTIVGELIAAPLVTLLKVPTEVYDLSLLYLRIYFLGMPVIMLYNFMSAIFRSQGDTRTPLICLTISGILNVGLNIFFVLVMGMSVEGVAIATVCANAVSSTMLIISLAKKDGPTRLRRKCLGMTGSVAKEAIRIGLPAGIQGMVFSISNLCIQSAINSLGPDIMAASSAAFNIEIVSFFVFNSFGQACTTFVGQNHGARQLDRCRRVSRIGLLQGMLLTGLFSVLILVFSRQLLGLFNDDPLVIEYGLTRIHIIAYFQVVNAAMEILSGCMRGYGYSLVPALIALFGICGTRIIYVYTAFSHVAALHTFQGLLICYPISWAITTLAIIPAYFHVLKRVKQDDPFERL